MEKKNENFDNKEEKNNEINIFKSTEFDFPLTNKNNLLNNSLSDEENINEIEDENELESKDEKESDINLTKQLEEQCDMSIYVNHLELDEKNDEDLLNLTKEEIINYKNYQILKLKAYIASLEKEKEDLINNYNITSETLLEKIKQLEYQKTGARPETPSIINSIIHKNKNNFKEEDYKSINQKNNQMYFNNDNVKYLNKKNINKIKQRCPNCQQDIIIDNFIEHSLQCLRKKYKCIYCNLLMDIDKKNEHFQSFYDKNKIIESLRDDNYNYIKKCLQHGFKQNEIILDENNNEYLIHILARKNKIYLLNNINGIDYDILNKDKETALIIAIENKNIESCKILINNGANIKIKNKLDLSPLMLCCKYNLLDIAEILIKKGANVNEKNILGDTPIKIAQFYKNEELALKLIKNYKAEFI